MRQTNTDPTLLANSALLLFQFVLGGLNPELRKENLSPTQLELLMFISEQDEPPTMTELSRHCAHSTAAGTGCVDRLEKLGFAERFHEVDDRRKIRVRMTKKGVDLLSSFKRSLAVKIADSSNERDGIQNALLALSGQ